VLSGFNGAVLGGSALRPGCPSISCIYHNTFKLAQLPIDVIFTIQKMSQLSCGEVFRVLWDRYICFCPRMFSCIDHTTADPSCAKSYLVFFIARTRYSWHLQRFAWHLVISCVHLFKCNLVDCLMQQSWGRAHAFMVYIAQRTQHCIRCVQSTPLQKKRLSIVYHTPICHSANVSSDNSLKRWLSKKR
jgi:hypothetical protein